MSNIETGTVQHDGIRNFFGGRNLIPGSTSPVFVMNTYTTASIIGQARVDISMLQITSAEFAVADYAVLNEIPPGKIGYGQTDESVLME